MQPKAIGRGNLTVFLATLTFVAACSGSSDDSADAQPDKPDPDEGTIVVTGTVQKGPFSQLSVQARPMADDGSLGSPLPVDISGDQYEVETEPGQGLMLEATGTFQDEVSGESVTMNQPLTSITVADDTPQNINVFTDFSAAHLKGNIEPGKSLGDQVTGADKTIMGKMGLPDTTNPRELDINAIPDNADLQDPNLALLLTSGSVMSLPRQPGRMPETYDNLVKGLGGGLDPEDILPALAGIDAAELYEQIRTSGVLSNLPDLVIDPGNTFVCEPTCGWDLITEPSLTIADVSVLEARGEAELTIRRAGAFTDDSDLPAMSVEVSTQEGTALAGFDFVDIEKTVELTEGQRRTTVTVPILIDALEEDPEQFTVHLANPSPAIDMGRSAATVTILDDLPAPDPDITGNVTFVDACVIGAGLPADPSLLGCADTLPPADTYVLDDPYALAVGLGVQVDCLGGSDCTVLDQDWPMTLTLLAEDSSGTEMDRTWLGDYIYPAQALYDGNAPVASPTQPLLASLNPEVVGEFLYEAWQEGWDVRLLASLEQGQQQVVATRDLPQLIPMPDTILFGEETLQISPEGLATIPPSASACAEGEIELEGTYLQPIEFMGQSGNMEYSGLVCAEYETPGDHSSPLIVTEGQLPMEEVIFPLPPMHRNVVEGNLAAALQDPESDGPPPGSWSRTTTAQPFLLMYGEDTDPSAVFRQYLTAEHLPYGYHITGGHLGPDGFVLHYDATRVITDPLFPDSDPRHDQWQANTVIYSEGQAGSLIIRDRGIETTTQFAGGTAHTGWPTGQIQWQGFSVTVDDSELSGNNVDLSYQLAQSTACREPGCMDGLHDVQSVSGSATLGQDGTLLAPVTITASDGVRWGARSDTDYAWERPDDLASSDPATLQLPGFRAAGDRPVVHHLMSHRALVNGELQSYRPGDSDFRRGNHFGPGITVGPQWYANNAGQPETGDGQDIGNRLLNVDLGPDQLPLTGHAASKYVLRNGGVTGVFNADPAQLPEGVEIYGYPIGLERFAVRLEDNRMDTYNWVDGGVDLAGDADFPVAFESLAIDCGGQLGAARLAAEQCDGGCQMASWRADTQFFDFRFTNDQGEPAAACSLDDQYLTLLQEGEFLALDKPVMLDVTWTSEGMVQRSVLQNQAQYRLDSTDEQEGFPITATTGELMTPWDDDNYTPARYGTVALGSKIGVPFWQALDSDVRLANHTQGNGLAAEPSLPLPRESLLDDSSDLLDDVNTEQPNLALQQDVMEDSKYDIMARYEWGNTGFGFELPVFYDLPDNHPGPQFLGRQWEQDLFVLEANAGIDYITPDSTKLSFGASADFERLRKLRFQVDLNSAASLAKVDDLLLQTGLISEPLLEPTLTAINQQVDRINAFANQGIDTVMEKALLTALEEAGTAAAPMTPNNQDPIETLVQGLAQARSMPDQLVAKLDEDILAPIYEELDDREQSLRSKLQELVDQLEVAEPTMEVPDEFFQALDAVDRQVDRAENGVRALLQPVDQILDEGIASVDSLTPILTQARDATNQVDQITEEISSFAATQCASQGSIPDPDVDGFLHSAWQHIHNLRSILETLEGGAVLSILAEQVIDDAATSQSMQDARDTIARNAELLKAKLDEAEEALRNELCSADIQQLLAQVTGFTEDTRDGLDQVEGALDAVKDELGALKETVAGLEESLLEPLEEFSNTLAGIRQDLEAQGEEPTYQSVDLAYFDSQLNSATNGRITVLVREEGAPDGDVDVFSFAFDGARSLLQSGRNELVELLQEELGGRLPMAHMNADQMRRHLVGKIMDSGPVKTLRETVNTELAELTRQLNDNLMMLADQANQAIREAINQVESDVNEALAEASGAVRDVPLQSASMDGYGVIAGHQLERAHLQAEWTMQPATDGEPGNTFGASLSAVSWNASNKAEGCAAPGADSNLDVTIAAMNLPARIGTSDITLKKVYLGFTLANAAGGDVAFDPMGVYGGLSVLGDIGFTEFIIYDPAFAAGMGSEEVYLGASAGAVFSDIQAEVAFLVGRTCNQDVLTELDPMVAEFIPIPDAGFAGAYARGSASIPVWSNGCPLTIGVSADMGAWALAGPPVTLGGLVGGGAYGKVLCIGSLRGQVRAMGSVTSDGDLSFMGEGFGVAGVGKCSPSSWTSVPRSREDSWCATGDARFQASYQNGWSILDLSTSAIH